MKNKPTLVKANKIHLDSDYINWINEIKNSFRNAQIKSAVKVNSEQIFFNWKLGRELIIKKLEEKWGSGIVEKVSLNFLI